MILRDLITRLTFRADTSALKTVDQGLHSLTGTVRRVLMPVMTGWAIKSERDFEKMQAQLKNRLGGAFDEVKRKMEDLHRTGIYSWQDLTEAAADISTALGKDPEGLTGNLLEMASLFEGRIPNAIHRVSQALGQMIQSGSTADFVSLMREAGLKDLTDESIQRIFQQQIEANAGVAAPLVRRQALKDMLPGMIAPYLQQLQAERDAMKNIPGVTFFTKSEDLWLRFRHLGVNALTPVLDVMEKLMTKVEKMSGGADHIDKVVRELVKPLSDFIDKPLTNWSIGGLLGTILGLATGGVKGAVVGGAVGAGGESMIKKRAPWAELFFEAPKDKADADRMYKNFMDVLPSWMGGPDKNGGVMPPLAAPPQSSINGDVHIYVNGTAQSVQELLSMSTSEIRRTVIDQLSGLETVRG